MFSLYKILHTATTFNTSPVIINQAKG